VQLYGQVGRAKIGDESRAIATVTIAAPDLSDRKFERIELSQTKRVLHRQASGMNSPAKLASGDKTRGDNKMLNARWARSLSHAPGCWIPAGRSGQAIKLGDATNNDCTS